MLEERERRLAGNELKPSMSGMIRFSPRGRGDAGHGMERSDEGLALGACVSSGRKGVL